MHIIYCTNAQSMSSKRILIVYLSRTNNTKAIAEIIQRNVGGTSVALEPQKPYLQIYKETVQQILHKSEA